MKSRVCAALLFSSFLQADPLKDMKLVGQGEMHWMFWKLYDAELYTPTGSYQAASHQTANYPLALELTYARNIDKKHLLEATTKEWRRLNIAWHPDWLKTLTQMWPSVQAGDQLICYLDESGESIFYFNGQYLGGISDPLFGQDFLAIWLSANSHDQELKANLIGESDD